MYELPYRVRTGDSLLGNVVYRERFHAPGDVCLLVPVHAVTIVGMVSF
jgi:hypothetical protein